MSEVPMPETHDPFYERAVGFLRGWLDEGRTSPVVVPMLSDGDCGLFGPTQFPKRLLHVKKAAGPAPYVGRPFAYVWPILIDDDGHYVAGSAAIHYMEHVDALR